MDKVFELMKFDEQKISNGFSNQVDEIDEARIEGTEIVEYRKIWMNIKKMSFGIVTLRKQN